MRSNWVIIARTKENTREKDFNKKLDDGHLYAPHTMWPHSVLGTLRLRP